MTVPNAESAQRTFRGAGELAKLLRRVSFTAELLATMLLVRGLVSERALSHDWRPLALLFLAVIILVCRRYAHRLDAFAHRCRRLALAAYAAGTMLDARLLADIEADAPTGSAALTKLLPANSLDEYYEPRCPPGDGRLRELY